MPLLHRKLFVPNIPSKHLDLNEEVFYCPLTNEIFLNYEDFYERTILCNSLVWSCSITDRPNLTYQEALDCEQAAREKLSNIPKRILKAILYLVRFSNRSRLDDLNEDIYTYVKDRYFIGESVDLLDKCKRLSCKIIKVISTRESSINGHVNGTISHPPQAKDDSSGEDDEDDIPLSSYAQLKQLEANEVLYIVRCPDETEKTVKLSSLKRKQGAYTRSISKLLLKANTIKPNGLATDAYVVRNDVKSKLKLESLSWDDMFVGPQPSFAASPKPQKTKKVQGNGSSKSNSVKEKENKMKDRLLKEKHEIKQAKELEKEVKRKEKEILRKRKAEEMEKLKEAVRMDKERRRKERERELIKLKVEKENMKHQKQEEKKRLAEYIKEWSRPRDDLECDDLKDLPMPQEVKSIVPPSLFGDVLSLLEFCNVFGNLFEASDEFPGGVTFDIIANAVMKHCHDGPLCDLLFFFLSNLFRTHSEEEEEFDQPRVEANDQELADELSEGISDDSVQAFSSLASSWVSSYQGYSLNKVELDCYTLTEVLRLYLLSSAARPRSEDRLWRFQHRGGYSVMDDIPSSFCIQNPEIVEKLSTSNVFDLEPEEKIAILQCLCQHLMTFVASRDFLEETWEKFQESQQMYRDDKIAEKRREREFFAEKAKFKAEQLNLERQARAKEAEEKLRRAELGISEEQEANERNLRKRKPENDAEPRLLEPHERTEKLRAFDEEENLAKDAWTFRLHKHHLTIEKYQISFRISCLGQDRYYRRYWAISSIAGIFVEEFVDDALTEDILTIRVTQKNSFQFPSLSGRSTPGTSNTSAGGTPVGNNTSVIPNISPGAQTLNNIQTSITGFNGVVSPLVTNGNCSTVAKVNLKSPVAELGNQRSPILQLSRLNPSSSSQTLPLPMCVDDVEKEEPSTVAPLTQGKQYRWLIYSSSDDVESLIASLNTRGYRESKLRSNLVAQKSVINDRFSRKKGSYSQFIESKKSTGVSSEETKCEKVMASLLRDQILDLESRIWGGTLGSVRVNDRILWRECLQNDVVCRDIISEDTTLPIIDDDEEDDKSVPICKPSISFPILPSNTGIENSEVVEYKKRSNVKDMAEALLLVERGIDRKYLKSPLGCAVDVTRVTRNRPVNDENEETKKKNSEILLKRWESSLLSSTSLSQVFLHLSTLERCIMWSRSVLNAKCRICKRKGDGDKMLLCDTCDRGHHMYCLKPALKSVPSGDWFCPDCKPKSSRLSLRKVVRTKSFSQNDSSDDEDDDSEEEEEEVDEAEEDETGNSESSEEEVPVRKSLTYKIPGRMPRNKKSSSPAVRGKPSEPKKGRTRREGSGKQEITGSKRRSTGVWKDLATCEEILSEMIKHNDSWPFLDPVSKKLVPDYYTIIKKPMDLGTILRKLKNVQYQTPVEFIEDVDQIFINCHEYNDSRSSIARTATNLQAFFEAKLNKGGLSSYRTPQPPAKKPRTN